MTSSGNHNSGNGAADHKEVLEQATTPFPASRKIYVNGLIHDDVRVPMREIELTDTASTFLNEKNPPVLVYDTSGPYTDPNVTINVREGLPAWIRDWLCTLRTDHL